METPKTRGLGDMYDLVIQELASAVLTSMRVAVGSADEALTLSAQILKARTLFLSAGVHPPKKDIVV